MDRITAGLLVVFAGCATGTPQPSDTPPPIPATIADRVGIYSWGFDDTSWPHTPDRLTWSAGEVAGLGTHVLRVAMTTADPYQANGGATTLHDIATQPAYAALWGDARWSTIIITAYTANDATSTWSDGYSADEQAAERGEIAELGTFLLGFPGKRFILMPWEGDNALASFDASGAAWDGYVDWITSRVDGVTDARAAVPNATSELYSGLEFNAVRRLDTGNACGVATDRCVISYVAPRVDVDYYSYSSWQSLGATVADSAVHDQLVSDLGTALAFVQAARPAATAARFIVGELGAARDTPDTNECSAAARTLSAISGATDFGASYAITWQIIDNPPAMNTFSGFGAYKFDGSESLTGIGLGHVWAGVIPALPTVSCPIIPASGVVNALTFDAQIHAGDAVSIFGTFTASGHVVHLRQGTLQTSVTLGSPVWYESPTQINFTLPSGIAGGPLLVYVSGTAKLDSDALSVTVL